MIGTPLAPSIAIAAEASASVAIPMELSAPGTEILVPGAIWWITPATNVPWPFSKSRPSCVGCSASVGADKMPLNQGCWTQTPVSTTPTVVQAPASPSGVGASSTATGDGGPAETQ